MGSDTTLFTNGTLFDGHSYVGPGELLVVDGRIAEVRQGVRRIEHPGAEVVDLSGAMLCPGFVDAHVHTVQGGLERLRCDLTQGSTREDYLRCVREYADARPEAAWILGGGWAMPAFPGGNPTAADLDAVVPDRPVFLPNRDHHGAWVNSRALELAGITGTTPDPPDGRFERDADGVPSGMLHEGAMRAVAGIVQDATPAEYHAALLEGQRHLHSLGVTGWQDAIVGAYSGMGDAGPAYAAAACAGELTAHVVGALWWDREQGLEQLPSLVARREEYSHGRFQATSVKIMLDGIVENHTAAMTSPYLDRCGHPTPNAGATFLEAAALREYVVELDAAGFQVHVHAIGDRSVREALGAFAGTDPGRRHHVAHVQVVQAEDVGRFARLGVAANLQMLWACLDDQMVDLTLPYLGEGRARRQYPFRDLERAGARLVAGSDWPVSTPDPFRAVHVAVNRTAYGEEGRAGTEPFLPEQAVSLETALAAYTSGSAWVNHRDVAGVLRVGAVADLAVLDRDPFAGTPDEIGATRVVSTWVDGVTVHQL